MTTSRKHVLDGFKVLDFTQFLAGPTVTRLMAEMGAEIVKVELAPMGDRTRVGHLLVERRSAYFVQQNRGKMSLCVDLKQPEGQALVRELVPKVDVLVENFAPGVIARLGFGYDAVKQLNPKLVMCSISALGQSGPLANDPGFDYIGQAYAGVTWLSGEQGQSPQPMMLGVGDVSTGVHALAAIACALLHRDRAGEGQYIDISLLDSYFGYQDTAIQAYTASGGQDVPQRIGPHYPGIAPAGLFKGKTGHFVIFAQLDHHWKKLCQLMGHPELPTDPRFATMAGRVKNRPALTAIIEQWLGSLPDDQSTLELMRQARLPVAPVLAPHEAIEHPHLRQRGTVRTIHDRLLGDFKVPGFPMRFSGYPQALELDAPLLGEHNQHILSTYLGYASEQIAELSRRGVLRTAAY